jgi:uncharacterized membrane protein YdjX (TVP38/TMEM64 family)
MGKFSRPAIIKAVLLALFILAAVFVFRFTSLIELLTLDKMKRLIDASGYWAPLVFIFIYILGSCLFVPDTVITILGGGLFGAYWGFVYVFSGAVLGATAAFFIGRYLGRDFISSILGENLKKYDKDIERNGFATVLYLRLVYFPFTIMNFGMGLTRVRFWDYFWGTFLGIIAGTFVFTFLVGTLKEIWTQGDWGRLISVKVFISVGLFVVSLFIPKIIKRYKKE